MPKDFSFCSTFNFSRLKKIQVEEFQNVDLVGCRKIRSKRGKSEIKSKKV